MNVIPVLDLKDGKVVHAKQGQREHYRPINSPLCSSSEPGQVIDAYLGLYPFKTFYIADLNAITGNSNHKLLLDRLLNEFSSLNFWVDGGYQHKRDYPHKNYYPVLGSEAYTEATYSTLKKFENNYILSLDFSDNLRLGPEQLFTPSKLWPKNIIIMALQQVGSNQGPDFKKLQGFVNQYVQYQFIAAGGVRNLQDLIALSKVGVNTALVASALHAGAISAEDLNTLNLY